MLLSGILADKNNKEANISLFDIFFSFFKKKECIVKLKLCGMYAKSVIGWL